MTQTLEALAHDAIELPPDQRLSLAHRILASVEPDGGPAVDAAWASEIRERIRKYDSGETTAVSASAVFGELDRRLTR